MSRKPKFDPAIHDENPEWAAKDFAKSRPASELPPDILAQFKNKVGRPQLINSNSLDDLMPNSASRDHRDGVSKKPHK